jgi:ABC-type transport system substrate-binding protein
MVDDTTWEFTLRDDVTFHDGTPFNADSVVATIERMIGLIEAGSTDNDGFYSTITGATKVDDYTVDITTSGPDGVLPARMYWLKMVTAADAAKEDLSMRRTEQDRTSSCRARPACRSSSPPIPTTGEAYRRSQTSRMSSCPKVARASPA